MRCLKRNMKPFWYCLYESSEDQYDEYGNLISEPLVHYAEPVKMYANISAATGQAQTEMFGGLESYDKVIVTDDMTCPIDEHTVLYCFLKNTLHLTVGIPHLTGELSHLPDIEPA